MGRGDFLNQRAHGNGLVDEWIIGLWINGPAKVLPDNPFIRVSINPGGWVTQTPWG
jgi:hypothetical protein